MIEDRKSRGYRTGQIKGKDFLYITGTPGMGGAGVNTQLAGFRYVWWAIEAHRLAILNTKIEIYNDNFEVYDKYLSPAILAQTPQPYRVLLSTKPPVNDMVDYAAVKHVSNVVAGTGIGKSWSFDESALPQPVDAGYDGKIYVIVDMLSTGRAPIGDIVLNASPEYEAMRTKIYDYEARL